MKKTKIILPWAFFLFLFRFLWLFRFLLLFFLFSLFCFFWIYINRFQVPEFEMTAYVITISILFYPFRWSWRVFGSFPFFFFAFFHSFFAFLRFFAPEIKIYRRVDKKKLLEHFEKLEKILKFKTRVSWSQGIRVHF